MNQPTALERAMGCMFITFLQKQGGNKKLSKKAFLELLNEQMPCFTKDDPDIGEALFRGVDLNEDGEVDFHEFAMMCAMAASANFDALQEIMNKQ